MGRGLERVDEYLARLPSGARSYPDVLIKGSVLRLVLAHPACAALADAEALPDDLRRLVSEPPIATSWHPEIHFGILTTALYALAFDDGTNAARQKAAPAAYDAWATAENAKLFATPLYRVLFKVVSPERLLGAISSRWGTFHRGTTLALVRTDRNLVELRLASPPHLYPTAALQAFTGAFRAAVQAAGGEVISIEWIAESPSSTRWVLQWGTRRASHA